MNRSNEIILVNFRNHRDMYPPFGLMYVADALRQAGYEPSIYHETEDFLAEFIERVRETQPLFVGFSTITGPQLKPTIDASRAVHALGVPVVWGGVHATIMPEDCLREDYIDYVVVNEGEETVVELANALRDDAPAETFKTIFGLAHKQTKAIEFVGERPFIANLDKYHPTWDLIPVERYLIQSGDYDRALPVYISRGCPFRCGFCYNEVVMKRTWRQHSDEYVVSQIHALQAKYNINAVDYADDYLFGRVSPMKRLVEKVGLPWSGQVRVHLLKPDFVKWMKDTNCQWVNIGAESGSQAVLDSMHKDQKAEHIEMAVRNLTEYAPHIEANLSFIVGLPEENIVERKVTFDLIEKLCEINEKARCSVCVYMPYPGTPLWQDALDRGFVPPDHQEGWCNFDLNRGNTPWVSDAESQVLSEINDILFVGRSRGNALLAPYYAMLRWRWRRMYFKYYFEGSLKHGFENLASRVGILKRMHRWLVPYNNTQTHKGPAMEGV